MTSICESFNTEQADRLLTENKFLDENDLWDVLQFADDEAYDYIYKNRTKYASNIQYLLEPKDFIPPSVKMRVSEMSVVNMKDIETKQTAARKQEFEDLWLDIQQGIEHRPYSDIDQDHDDAWEMLSNVRDRITAYLSKKSGKYVPPSSRTKTDIGLEKLEKELEERKEFYQNIEKRIDEEDNKYLAMKKDEYYQKWLLSV